MSAHGILSCAQADRARKDLAAELARVSREHDTMRDALAEVLEEIDTLKRHGRLTRYEHLQGVAIKAHAFLVAGSRAATPEACPSCDFGLPMSCTCAATPEDA